jgi:hypothetical protein
LAVLGAPGCAASAGNTGLARQPWTVADLEVADLAPKDLFTLRPAKPQARSVMVVGDSLSISLGEQLERLLPQDQGLAFARLGKVSSGLARPEFFDWEQHMAAMARRCKPDVALVMLGTNDNKQLKARDGSIVAFGTKEWDREYAAKAQRLIDICRAQSPGAAVFWIGAPVMADATLSRDLRHINAVLVSVVKGNRGCHFVDTWAVFSDKSGNFVRCKPDVQGGSALRAGDGVHLTLAGAQALAQWCLSAMAGQVNFAAIAPSGPAALAAGLNEKS